MTEEPCRRPEAISAMGKTAKVLSSLDPADPRRGALFADVSRAAEWARNCPCGKCCVARAARRMNIKPASD